MSVHGMTLRFISRSSGLGQSKIKMILSRHEELQGPPYSTKVGGSRVFFQPFVEWLAKYEGEEAARKMSHESHKPVTAVTRLPSGAQLHELRLMAEKGRLSSQDLRVLLGLEQPIFLPSPKEEKATPEITDKASPEVAAKAFPRLLRIAECGGLDQLDLEAVR
jgi:hypothetical protein